MDAPGLTKTRIIVALICGILLAFVYTYATVPHLVSTPVQVITPVPTPPPVVITSQPVSVPSQPYFYGDYILDNMWWLVAIMLIIPIIIFLIGIFSQDDNDFNNRRSSSGSGLISLIITIIIMGITLWILSIVLNSVVVALSVMP
jgi:hypothetical protein